MLYVRMPPITNAGWNMFIIFLRDTAHREVGSMAKAAPAKAAPKKDDKKKPAAKKK